MINISKWDLQVKRYTQLRDSFARLSMFILFFEIRPRSTVSMEFLCSDFKLTAMECFWGKELWFTGNDHLKEVLAQNVLWKTFHLLKLSYASLVNTLEIDKKLFNTFRVTRHQLIWKRKSFKLSFERQFALNRSTGNWFSVCVTGRLIINW